MALHDFGKPEAIKRGDKHLQHECTVEMILPILKKAGLSEAQQKFALVLVGADPVGEYLRGGSVEHAAKTIHTSAAECGQPVERFFDALVTFYKADASSYTTDAEGGQSSLEHLFTFDHEHNRLGFSPANEKKMELLRSTLGIGR